MKFLAAFANRKVKGSKPVQVPLSTFERTAEAMGLEGEPRVWEKENVYSGKFYGRYAMIQGDIPEIPEHRFLPVEVARACRKHDGKFAYAEAGQHGSDHKNLQYMDLMVVTVGVPVYHAIVRHVHWFSTDRDAIDSLGRAEELKPYSLYSCTSGDYFPVLQVKSGTRVALMFSGGIASSVAAMKLKKEGYTPYLLHFLQGHELSAGLTQMAYEMGLEIDYLKDPDPWTSYPSDDAVPFSPLLSRVGITAHWAVKSGAHHIATGDSVFDSGQVGVLDMALASFGPPRYHLSFLAPVAGMSKQEIIQTGEELGVNLVRTRSCEEHKVYCGWCEKCKGWEEAFASIGQKDPRSML